MAELGVCSEFFHGVDMARQPRDRFYDGKIYARFSDRQMAGFHKWLAREIGEVDRVLDACCGTGGLTFRLADQCGEVIGIDLSPRNIEWAERRKQQLGVENVKLVLGDAEHAADKVGTDFDLVTAVMALHEMPHEARVPVLKELVRLGKRVMICDFSVPMPWNLAGARNRFIEFSSGPKHFGAFRDYYRRGGLDAIIAEAGVKTESERTLDRGTLTLRFVHS